MSTGVIDLDVAGLHDAVSRALAEDLGRDMTGGDLVDGDVTTQALVAPHDRCAAEILVKEPGVVCGLPVVEATMKALDPAAVFEPLVGEGHTLAGPAPAARVQGLARAILAAERTSLNFLGRLSGVATLTRAFVDAVAGTRAIVLDTRKTSPGLRPLEKYATRTGGAQNHRRGLYDAVLVKDNHLRVAGGVAAAVSTLRAATTLPIEVEVESLEDVVHALDAGADLLLLDNMSVESLAEAVAVTAGRARLEASGGVSLDNIAAVARTGVDFISVGALTHSARWLDVSLEVL